MSFGKYRLVCKKGEGTFSEVIKAQCLKNGEYVAIKCMKNTFKSVEQVNDLREIQALRRLNPHPNIIGLLDVLFDRSTGRLALVFELFDMNVYELIRFKNQTDQEYLAPNLVRLYMYKLITAIAFMHQQNIFHRDIKPENILIKGDQLKLADFGSCRGIYTKPPFTEYISTRWYRAPESLLTNGYYDCKMDLWGVGCVMFEIISLMPLFPGSNELDQIERIHNVLGTPPREIIARFLRQSTHIKDVHFPHKDGSGIHRLIPRASKECVDLIKKLLIYDPKRRVTAVEALQHPYFLGISDIVSQGQVSCTNALIESALKAKASKKKKRNGKARNGKARAGGRGYKARPSRRKPSKSSAALALSPPPSFPTILGQKKKSKKIGRRTKPVAKSGTLSVLRNSHHYLSGSDSETTGYGAGHTKQNTRVANKQPSAKKRHGQRARKTERKMGRKKTGSYAAPNFLPSLAATFGDSKSPARRRQKPRAKKANRKGYGMSKSYDISRLRKHINPDFSMQKKLLGDHRKGRRQTFGDLSFSVHKAKMS